tara:strand:+ start:822 stop:1433 length:612 start_codon:yes stop_codon:yes gene_type:complete
MVSVNTIGVTFYTILLITLHLVLPTKYLKNMIYGSEYTENDKLKVKDLFFKPYGFRNIGGILKTLFLTPFMLSFYLLSLFILIVFDLSTEKKMYRIYLLCYLLIIMIYIGHSGYFMFTETDGILGDSMIIDELENLKSNKIKNRKLLMNYKKVYNPKWIMLFLLIPIYVTLFSNGVKFFKNEFLTLVIMLLCMFLVAFVSYIK